MASGPKFCSLVELIDCNHAVSPSPKCAQLKTDETPCGIRMNRQICIETRSVVEKHLTIFTGIPGKGAEGSLEYTAFQELAAINLCRHHKKHETQAITQWLNESLANEATIIASLKRYYDLRSHTISTDLGRNPNNQKSFGDSSEESGNSASSENDDTLEADIPIASIQSPSAIKAIRRAQTIADYEVAQNVTKLLETRLSKDDKVNGFIYVIKPLNLGGKLKIGHTATRPELQRLRKHEKCYGESRILTTTLIQHARRVEQLVLQELSNHHHKLEKSCHYCKAVHREILEVDQKVLSECLVKWIKFLHDFAYSAEGKLRSDAKNNLPPPAKVCFLARKGGRRSSGGSPDKKDGSQGPLFISADSILTELTDEDALCSEVENLRLSPDKPKH